MSGQGRGMGAMRVIVLLGGNSPERDVSLVSGRAVGAALLRRGHRVTAVDTAGGRLVELDAKRAIGSEPPTTALVPEGDAVHAVEKLGAQAFGEVDVVFIALHGSTNVPPYPDSHGCVRLTTWDSDFLNRHMFMGIPVHVYRSSEGPVYGSDGPFADVPADHVFADAIQWMVDNGYTNGCSQYFYCVNDSATRGEIAAFLKRTLEPHLGSATHVEFIDTRGHVFEDAVGWLAGHGITEGCNPPDNTQFCPDRSITRGEISALFKRAVEHPIAVDPASVDPTRFSDTQSSLYVNSAAWLAATATCWTPCRRR